MGCVNKYSIFYLVTGISMPIITIIKHHNSKHYIHRYCIFIKTDDNRQSSLKISTHNWAHIIIYTFPCLWFILIKQTKCIGYWNSSHLYSLHNFIITSNFNSISKHYIYRYCIFIKTDDNRQSSLKIPLHNIPILYFLPGYGYIYALITLSLKSSDQKGFVNIRDIMKRYF
jgi:hypothetical protein